MRFINELREDEHIVEYYLCKQKQSLKSKTGKTYYSLKLQDKTGVIDAKVWDLNKDIQSFEENDYIKIDGAVLNYNNSLQIKITKIRRAEEGEYAFDDYIPTTQKDINKLYDELIGYINTLKEPCLKEMMTNIYVKHEVISKAIKTHSAAKTMHHNYLGGLLEHTVSVVQICDFMSKQYPTANRDILLVGAMMHDVGKIYELSEFPINDYTDEGQLLGHLMIGMELVTEESSKIEGFPKSLKMLIKHCIISHHGELEYGSPKVPETIEAFILHCVDNLDAKVKVYEEAIETNDTQGAWTGYNKMLGRNIRKSTY